MMTKVAFTPGPWEASLEAVRFVIQHTPEDGMGKRALAYTGGAEPANPFNARLIAASPSMYAALELFVKQWEACGPNSDFGRYFQSTYHTALDALAEAGRPDWRAQSAALLAQASL